MAIPKDEERKKRVKRMSRATLGATPAGRAIEPETRRRKPKHRKPPEDEESADSMPGRR